MSDQEWAILFGVGITLGIELFIVLTVIALKRWL